MNLMDRYFVFLGYLPLPVTPEKIEINVPNLNKSMTLVDLGEVNVIRGAGLKEISFDILLPSFNYPFANYSFGSFSTSQAIGYLEYLKQSGDTAQFIVVRCRKGLPAWWTNIRTTLEDVTFKEDANEGTDVIASVTLKEYREYKTKVATVTKKEDGTVTATFENERQFGATGTGNISPFLLNLQNVKGADDTTIQIYEFKSNTTIYNETKKMASGGSRAAVKAIKKANPTVKNVVQKGTQIKPPYTSTVPYSTWVDKPKYMSTIADKPNIIHSDIFGDVTYDELVKKSGSINRPNHVFWDKNGNIHRSGSLF